MGEGIMEATVINWLKNIGDSIGEDESIVEIATDKVDSDVPSPVAGTLKEILIPVDGVAIVGEPIAILSIEGKNQLIEDSGIMEPISVPDEIIVVANHLEKDIDLACSNKEKIDINNSTSERFYSPLVRSIAKEEGISENELNLIIGSGVDGRVTKDDIKNYLLNRDIKPIFNISKEEELKVEEIKSIPKVEAPIQVFTGEDEILEMDRMRKLIAQNMVQAKQIAPHVTSFVEVDVTNIVLWREKNKKAFETKYGEKITYMPIFIEAVTRAIKDFPMINVSVDGDKIIKKKNTNIGMAAALPSGNLIVPVIKNADQFNLSGLAKQVNHLAINARSNKLKPVDIQGATYTITNIGTFGNVLGTPIIPQPQVAILAVGAIVKKPAVIETPTGDVIGIRHKMYLSHAYDHRVVDGALGGMFVKRVAEYLEAFDINTSI